MTRDEPRTAAEWVAFAIASVVLLVVVGLVAAQMGGSDRPAAPVISMVDAPREENGLFFVTAEVENRGDETAVNVQVTGELTVGDDTTTGDQMIDFLAADETASVVFVFADDPATGELSIDVSSFSEP